MEDKKIFDETTTESMYLELKKIDKYNKINIGDRVKYNRRYVDYSNGVNYWSGDYEYDDGEVVGKKYDGTNYFISVKNIFGGDALSIDIENIYIENLYMHKNDDHSSKYTQNRSDNRRQRVDGKVKSVRKSKKSKRKSKRSKSKRKSNRKSKRNSKRKSKRKSLKESLNYKI